MTRRCVSYLVCVLLCAVSAVCSAQQDLTYSGPFVSVNSPLKLCATATDGGNPVGGVPVWFQAWTPAGIPRTTGPMSAILTNCLGIACNNFNLNEGLYVVQAFGDNGFGGVSSEPVVVSNWKTGRNTEATSAGIATYRFGRLGPECEAAFGILTDHGPPLDTVAAPKARVLGRPGIVSQCPRSAVTFLWLDDCNPAGPTRIEVRNYNSSLIVQQTNGMVRLQICFSGYTWVTIGGMKSLMWTEFCVQGGPGPRLQPVNADEICVAGGTFQLRVLAFSGQTIYDVSGTFTGTTCTFFPQMAPP